MVEGSALISVVIPAYQAAAVIGRCIESLQKQTYRELELIVVDDGSNDDTADVVAKLATDDPRIRLLRQENAGVSAARNAGIGIAAGELVCFVDCDDTVSPNFLETLYGLYAPSVLPVADIVRSDGEGSALMPMPPVCAIEAGWPQTYFCGDLGQQIAFSVWNKLFSIQVLKRENISFAEEVSIGEDMLFVFRYLCQCREIRFSAEAAYRYTIAEGSAMHDCRDYTQDYEITLRELQALDEDPVPVGGEVIAQWAFTAVIQILANPYITRKDYRAFLLWWRDFQSTALYRAAKKSPPSKSFKRRVLQWLIYTERTKMLHWVLRILRNCRSLVKAGDHDDRITAGTA